MNGKKLMSSQGVGNLIQEDAMFITNLEMSVYEMFGFIGVALYLGSYAALQIQLLDCKGIIYPLSNFLAAGCVLISLSESFNMSSAIIQISWIAISSVGITRLLIKRFNNNKLEDVTM